MRNNLLNFAEFERETIAARVADAYNTKSRETGFYQGGKMYYGYDSERRTVNGKRLGSRSLGTGGIGAYRFSNVSESRLFAERHYRIF